MSYRGLKTHTSTTTTTTKQKAQTLCEHFFSLGSHKSELERSRTRRIKGLVCHLLKLPTRSKRKTEEAGEKKSTQGKRMDSSILLLCPLTTAPRVPCSRSFSAPGDGGSELMSVILDVTSVRSEVKSELKSELGSDSTPLAFGNT